MRHMQGGEEWHRKKAAIAGDAAALISDFVNVRMKGSYTLEDFLRHFNTPDSSSSMTDVLRRLIDEGRVSPPIR